MTINICGKDVGVTIPTMHDDDAKRKIRPGDRFSFTSCDRDEVLSSTLPSLPGTTIMKTKGITYAHAMYSLSGGKFFYHTTTMLLLYYYSHLYNNDCQVLKKRTARLTYLVPL